MALLANLRGLTDLEMMSVKVENGAIFLFERTTDAHGKSRWIDRTDTLANPILPKSAPTIDPPPVDPPKNAR